MRPPWMTANMELWTKQTVFCYIVENLILSTKSSACSKSSNLVCVRPATFAFTMFKACQYGDDDEHQHHHAAVVNASL